MATSPQAPPALKHIGFILDGNRRWAVGRGLPKMEGHRRGYENLKKIGDFVFERGIPYMSAYIFSTENWRREKSEVKYLLDFALRAATTDLEEIHQKGFKLQFAGSREGLSSKLQDAIEKAMEKTKGNTKGTLVLCFNYGGHEEIVAAVKQLVRDGVPINEIDENAIATRLYTANIPEPDLIVRAGGEQRLSNFLLWDSAYAELAFPNVLWPDFDEAWLDRMIEEYNGRKRRFGR